MRTPQEVRVANWVQAQRSGYMKQYRPDAFDRQVIKDAAKELGLKRYLTLHPSWMYQDLHPYWDMKEGFSWLLKHARYTPIKAPTIEGVPWPKNFIAINFYFRATFPSNATTVSFVKATIEKIAKTHPVVILDAGSHVDDHLTFLPKSRENITVLSEVIPMTPENNLAVQTAAIGRCSAFIGTYGGMAQLSNWMGKPVICYYDQWHSVCLAHRLLSEILAIQVNIPFTVLKVGDLPMLQQFTPTASLLA